MACNVCVGQGHPACIWPRRCILHSATVTIRHILMPVRIKIRPVTNGRMSHSMGEVPIPRDFPNGRSLKALRPFPAFVTFGRTGFSGAIRVLRNPRKIDTVSHETNNLVSNSRKRQCLTRLMKRTARQRTPRAALATALNTSRSATRPASDISTTLCRSFPRGHCPTRATASSPCSGAFSTPCTTGWASRLTEKTSSA